MKTSKFTASAVLLIIVLLVSSYSQDTNSSMFKKQFYFQAGCTLAHVISSGPYRRHAENLGFMSSAGYRLDQKISLNFIYIFSPELYEYKYIFSKYNAPDYVDYRHEIYDGYIAHKTGINVNYFFRYKLKGLTTYISGGIIGSFEKIKTYDELHWDRYNDTTIRVEHYDGRFDYGQHIRILLGPQIGTGIFIALGKINFQQELTFSEMYSIYNDRNYKRFSINLNTGIVYKF